MARVAILAAKMFEDIELLYPRYRLIEAGHDVDVLGAEAGEEVTGKKGDSITVDVGLDDAKPDQYAAVVVPGGFGPDFMRRDERYKRFLEAFKGDQRPVAAICHGPWMLITANLVRGCRVTSFPTLRDDLKNAGAEWADREVVVDGRLITSRKPDDLPAFMKALTEQL